MRIDTRCSSRSRASRAGVSLLRKSHTGLETVTLFLQVPPQAAILDRTNDTAPRVKGSQGGGVPILTDISASYFTFLSSRVTSMLSKANPNSSPKFIFYLLLNFKPQHPLKSKNVSIPLLLSSKRTISLGSPYNPPKITETICPSPLLSKN